MKISGSTAIVGARLDDDRGDGSGSAYIFGRDEGGANNWGCVAKLTAGDGAAGDEFGNSVSISGDTAIVGAGQDDDTGSVFSAPDGDIGSAYIFGRNVGGADSASRG